MTVIPSVMHIGVVVGEARFVQADEQRKFVNAIREKTKYDSGIRYSWW